MNNVVGFENAKLLKEKGFNEPKNTMYCRSIPMFEKHHVVKFHDGNKHECSNIPHDWNNTHSPIKSTSYYSAPTIAEVVMWLYEKHGIWIYPLPIDDDMKLWQARIIKGEPFNKLNNTLKIISYGEISYRYIYSPTEAYEAAIKYVLENLV